MTATAWQVVEPARVPLVGGSSALVDACDFRSIAGLPWRLLRGHNGKQYAYARVGDVTTYLHRLILGAPQGLEVDHLSGDGLDNRRANLRLATQSQNSANSWKPRRADGAATTSQYKGVSWDRTRDRWQAKVTIHGVCRNLGRYDDEAEAARAYDAAALSAWGDFARVNFPNGMVTA